MAPWMTMQFKSIGSMNKALSMDGMAPPHPFLCSPSSSLGPTPFTGKKKFNCKILGISRSRTAEEQEAEHHSQINSKHRSATRTAKAKAHQHHLANKKSSNAAAIAHTNNKPPAQQPASLGLFNLACRPVPTVLSLESPHLADGNAWAKLLVSSPTLTWSV